MLQGFYGDLVYSVAPSKIPKLKISNSPLAPLILFIFVAVYILFYCLPCACASLYTLTRIILKSRLKIITFFLISTSPNLPANYLSHNACIAP